MIDFGHLSLANTQSLNRKKTISEGQDSKAEMDGKECYLIRMVKNHFYAVMFGTLIAFNLTSLYGIKLNSVLNTYCNHSA